MSDGRCVEQYTTYAFVCGALSMGNNVSHDHYELSPPVKKTQSSWANFEVVGTQLCEAAVLLKEDSLQDAKIIEAASAIKNKSRARHPEMHQTKKGNHWNFSMKTHIGVEAKQGYEY